MNHFFRMLQVQGPFEEKEISIKYLKNRLRMLGEQIWADIHKCLKVLMQLHYLQSFATTKQNFNMLLHHHKMINHAWQLIPILYLKPVPLLPFIKSRLFYNVMYLGIQGRPFKEKIILSCKYLKELGYSSLRTVRYDNTLEITLNTGG